MITKQAELKKQAYESNLKSRALSVLIYLIDRANNRGQSSNLYTLILLPQAPTPNNDNTLNHEDNIDIPDSKSNSNTSVTYISFATLQTEKQDNSCPAFPLLSGGRGWGSICSPLELLKLTIYKSVKVSM